MKNIFFKTFIIFVIIISLTSTIIYINQINIYGDFSIKVFYNQEDITNDVNIKGVSFFKRKTELVLKNQSWHSETWYFKKLIIQAPKYLDNAALLTIMITDKNGKIQQQNHKISDNTVTLDSLNKNNSFFNKLNYIFPLNWLNSIISYILVLCCTIVILLIINKRKNNALMFNPEIVPKLRFIIISLLFISGIILRFNNPTDIILAYDYNGHISPVYQFFEHGKFDHKEWAYPYPLFIIVVLSIFNDINAICPIQHIASVLAIVGFVIFLEYKFRNRKNCINFQVTYTVLASFVFGVLLTNGNFILYEKFLHHEGLIIPSILFTSISLILYLDPNNGSRRTLWFAFAIFSLFFTSLLQYRFTVGFFSVAMLLLINEVYINKKTRPTKIILSISILLVIYFLVFTPERYLVKKHDPSAPYFAYKQFVFSNAKTVLKLIESDKFIEPKFDTTFFKPQIKDALNHSNKASFQSLEYNFDYLKYKLVIPSLVEHITREYSDSCLNRKENEEILTEKYNIFFKDWAFLLIKEYPVEVFTKSLKQLSTVTIQTKVNYVRYDFNNAINNPKITSIDNQKLNWLSKRYKLKTNTEYTIIFPQKHDTVFNFMDILIKSLFIVSICLILFGFIKRKVSLLNFSFLIIISCTLITVAILHSFDISRYLHTLLPFVLILILFTLTEIIPPQKLDTLN